jgi:hypothetical protein
MTSPRPETTDRTEQIEDKDKDKPQGGQLSATQIAAGALAAVSSAVVASFFGLAGTLIGAALASVISTVSAALYSSSLKKTNEKLRRARGQLTGRQSPVEETRVAPAAADTPATQVLPAHLDPRRAPARRSRPRWTKVAVYAAAVFVVAMGIVTGIELIGQKPVSALVGNSDSSGSTTLDELTNVSSYQDTTPTSPSSPTTTAPAETSPSEAPETGVPDSESSSSTTSSSEASTSSSSGPESSATPTHTAGTSSSPAQETAPTP